MTEETTPTNYAGMYNSEEPVDEGAPVVEETPVEETPVEETPAEETPTEEADSEDTFVMVNVDPGGKLRVRDGIDGAHIGTVDAEEILKVIDDTNSEWLFVETTGDKVIRGYVKKTFIAEV